MKAKMSYKSKKIAIITAVVLVLIAAISVGTYFFVQGNDNAQAAYTENDNLAQTGNGESDTTETNNGSEGQTNPTDEQNDGNAWYRTRRKHNNCRLYRSVIKHLG